MLVKVELQDLLKAYAFLQEHAETITDSDELEEILVLIETWKNIVEIS